MANIANLATFQAGQIGFQINFNLGSNAPTLTGSTISLIVKSPDGTIATYSCSAVGNVVSYITNGSDFASVGKYQIQIKVSGSGELYEGPILGITILGNLL